MSNKNKKSTKRKSRKKTTAKNNNFLTILAGVALGFILVFAIIAVDLFSKMDIISIGKNPSNDPSGFVEVTEAGDDIGGIETLEELRSDGDLSSILKNWGDNTSENTLMKNKNVINFLLIGLDASESNADAIILASLNKETKKIHLTSFFRDSYTYIKTDNGPKYAKINACYANGGAEKLIETIQNNYKIKIDYYVSVNFDSFSKIVDILGGITLDVQPYEARAVGCPSGEGVRLNGTQALTFCRIRYTDADADVSRTRRQRQFINALIDEVKNINVTQISPLLNTVIKYIKTDCGVTKIISLGTQALTEKWYEYEIVSGAVPSEEHRMDYRGNAWVWIVDYPAAAQALQKEIYGVSNIELKPDRVSAIDVMKNNSGTGNANP